MIATRRNLTTGSKSLRSNSAIAFVVLVVLVASVSCSASTDSVAPGAGAGSNAQGISHVHGLGIDPSDSTLYAAGHYGVFSIRDGKAQRQGELIQDTMGFTVAGPKRFLGSGHPDVAKDTILKKGMRGLLGLIESKDQAVTWQGLSLQGEVDFHSLTFAHGRVYGADATGGRFLVSTDLTNWDTRSSIALASIAVSPTEPDTIIGTSEKGPVRSTDGGRNWQTVAGSPALLWVSWDSEAGLWAATAAGEVWRSKDATAWERAGLVTGKAAAIYAHPSGIYVATDTAIVRSKDGGKSFETVVKLAA